MTFGNVLIFGDSYSTFKDCVPDGYAVYYTTERTAGPNITDVNDTWWHSLISETESKLILNDSWSGSTICHTGYCGVDCSHTSSFIFRLRQMIESRFFESNDINTVFVFGATNDNWAGTTVGTNKYEDVTEEDLYLVLPGISYFLGLLRSAAKDARIVFIINSELKRVITEGIIDACDHYGAEYVLLSDIEKDAGHPTVLGMKEIKNQIIKKLDS